ncbi:MAG TPA: hypothetical protein VKV24_14100 [Casimicrobiaceae bacterium]|nr:hypothetical protein [Casimicrobiaceae bacterium]
MGYPVDLKSDRSLIHALDEAKSQKMTAKQLKEQRVSFIYSSMDDGSGVTREGIRAVLDQHEGALEA